MSQEGSDKIMTHFEQELLKLKENILNMASHSKSAVVHSVRALIERDKQLGLLVETNDKTIDDHEVEIDTMAVNLLAKAPLAKDLRFITVALKISMELERIGDESTTIARRAVVLSDCLPVKDMKPIKLMVEFALQQLNDAITCFARKDPAKAASLIPLDKQLDRMHKDFSATIIELIKSDVNRVSQYIDLMVVSKSLERIGDHASNIAEEVVYMNEAKDIRHSGIKEANSSTA